MHKTILRAALVVVASILPVGLAAGDEVSYDALVQEGTAEFRAGRWVEAYGLFKRAHAVSPNARTLRAMGIASYELGEYPRALRELGGALDSQSKPLSDAQRAEVESLSARASRRVGTVSVQLEPSEARLFVNHQERSERELVVTVGKVSLRAEHEGYRPLERVVTVDSGQHHELGIELVPIPSLGAEPPEARPVATDLEPERSRVSPAASSSREDRSLVRNPWLWTGVGAVVVGVVVTAVTLGVRRRPEDEPFPEGNVGLSFMALPERSR